jgi:HDOD domain
LQDSVFGCTDGRKSGTRRLSLEGLPDVKVADLPTLEFLSGILDTLAAGDRGSAGLSAGREKVQEAFKDPDYTPQKIARVVATERTLADRLLQMVNSTAFTATGRVTARTLSPN